MRKEKLVIGRDYYDSLGERCTLSVNITGECRFKYPKGGLSRVNLEWVLMHYKPFNDRTPVAGEIWANRTSKTRFKILDVAGEYVLFRSDPFSGRYTV